MRKAIVLLVILSLVFCLGSLACNNDGDPINETAFNGTDTIVREFRIGSAVIQNGGLYQIALEHTDTMTFHLEDRVDDLSFEQFLDLKLIIHNVDRDQFYILTKPSMLENGYFTIYDDGLTVEYRMRHTMEKLWVGGTPQDFVSPGETLIVTVDYVSGRDEKGDWFAFRFDEFSIVYSQTTF